MSTGDSVPPGSVDAAGEGGSFWYMAVPVRTERACCAPAGAPRALLEGFWFGATFNKKQCGHARGGKHERFLDWGKGEL